LLKGAKTMPRYTIRTTIAALLLGGGYYYWNNVHNNITYSTERPRQNFASERPIVVIKEPKNAENQLQDIKTIEHKQINVIPPVALTPPKLNDPPKNVVEQKQISAPSVKQTPVTTPVQQKSSPTIEPRFPNNPLLDEQGRIKRRLFS
jgi:hypothetical protein